VTTFIFYGREENADTGKILGGISSAREIIDRSAGDRKRGSIDVEPRGGVRVRTKGLIKEGGRNTSSCPQGYARDSATPLQSVQELSRERRRG